MTKKESFDLFVPGRLCLMGEHSDWAGRHRALNASIVPGMAIVTGIEQGIYATIEKSDKFIVDSELDFYKDASFSCEMDPEKLRETAQEGGFFSYVAGVASYVYENYSVKGLHIRITKMDLPIKSGLSSSAAVCVLVARAFNIAYKLRLNTMGEMQIAFFGEQRTPSRCGRLDQACAYGVKPVCMVFDGNEISVKPITIKAPMHWVIADLKAGKDTVRILADLNKCFPFAETELEFNVQEALGADNKRYIEESIKAIEAGDNELLGRIMVDFQKNFDKKVAPACPKELTSPVLHSVLADEHIKTLVYGMKGVGSQGDGTVQFLAKDEASQQALMKYLIEEKGMEPFPLTLRPQQAVTRAIIPVAGFGTRLFPATKGIKKDFFPVLDSDGIFKPAIMTILEQLHRSGVEKICLVIGEEDQAMYDNFFAPLKEEHMSKLPAEKQAYERLIEEIGKKITYVYQRERKGFGHAVYQCKDFADGEPVLLLLGDMIYESNTNETCSAQMIAAYEESGLTTVSIHEIPVEDVVHYGILHGTWDNEEETLLKLDAMVEKPTVAYAEEFLGVKNKKGEEKYYCVFGQYILTKEVFDVLGENIRENKLSRDEIQLTDALETVRERFGMVAFAPNGKSYDVGLPEVYRDTLNAYGKSGK